MSTDCDTTRIVRSWLEVGATALPDRVLDQVLDQLPTTSQRRAWWPARRFQEMSSAWKFAIAAAAIANVPATRQLRGPNALMASLTNATSAAPNR